MIGRRSAARIRSRNDRAAEGKWVFEATGKSCTKGDAGAYSKWADNQPNSYGGDQDCAIIEFVHWGRQSQGRVDDEGRWDDMDCNRADIAAVCKIPNKDQPPPPPQGSHMYPAAPYGYGGQGAPPPPQQQQPPGGGYPGYS